MTIVPWLLARTWALVLTCSLAASAAQARPDFPRTVTDVAGRAVVLKAPPQRIFMANGNHVMALLLLEREDPWARLSGWANAIRSSDPTTWAWLRSRWPHAVDVPELKISADVHADIEQLLALKPDLLLLDLRSRPAVESGPLHRVAQRMGIPILYADTSREPVRNTLRTVTLLGEVLGREGRATEYVRFYSERLERLQRAQPAREQRPTVFLEVRAGRMGLEQCCYTQGATSWGQLIEAAGGINLGNNLLRGINGDVSIETLMQLKPDLYLMTGTQQRIRGARTIPFGLGADKASAQDAMWRLMRRPGLALASRGANQCVLALTHQFHDNPMNIVGLEYLARGLYTVLRDELDPVTTWRAVVDRFTSLPQMPFVFEAAMRWGGGACQDDESNGVYTPPT